MGAGHQWYTLVVCTVCERLLLNMMFRFPSTIIQISTPSGPETDLGGVFL